MLIRNKIHTGRLIGSTKWSSFNIRFRSSYHKFYTSNQNRIEDEVLELEYVVNHIKR